MTIQDQTPPRLFEFMADTMSYPSHYNAQYYQHPVHPPAPVAPPPSPTDTSQSQRKRPKYTRSKTGCMTCRVKKIKCDETKPSCMRCTHGQRECTWPEGIPARKKSVVKKEPTDRPSTAGSSEVSESSATPPTRERTPPRRTGNDAGLVSLSSRRPTNEHYVLHAMPSEPDPTRRLSVNSDRPMTSGYSHAPANQNILNVIPESASYPSHPRYEHSYPHNGHSSRHAGYRPLNHEPVSWNTPEYFAAPDRSLVASHHMPTEPHTRYQ